MNSTSSSFTNRIKFLKVFTFLFALLVSFQVFAQPANDDCSTAALLTAGTCCSMSLYTTTSATGSAEITPTCGGYGGGDVWFQVVVPASGHLVFNTSTTNSSCDGSMAIYSGSCGALTEIQCNADNGTSLDPYIDNSTLTPGSTVYVRYWQNGGGAGCDFSICVFSPSIQPPCTNLGFEDGFNGWTGSIGNSITGPAGALTPTYYPAIWCPAINSDPNLTLVTGGTDAYGGFPKVYSGTASLQISDVATSTDNETYNAASAEQTFMVDPSNTKFIIHYAAVLQNGGHPANIQPFFKMELLDQTGTEFNCVLYIVTVPYPGFVLASGTTDIYYKPWTEVDVNLTNYVGQYVTARFSASDCEHSANGAHFGYAYIDCECAPYVLNAPDTICLGQTGTVSAPPGAAAYLWSTGETTPTITLTPTVDTTVYVTISEIAVDTCKTVLQASIIVRPFVPPTSSSNSPICQGTTLNLFSTPASALLYDWAGPNGFTSNVQNPTITNATPAATGDYTVTVIKGGCTATSLVSVVVNPSEAINATSNSPICEGGTVIFNNPTTIPGVTYQWNGPGGFSSTNQNPTFPNATPSVSGVYTITNTFPGGCTETATITITVNSSLVVVASTVSNVSCYGLSNGVTTVATSNGITPYGYQWNTSPPQTTQNATGLPPGTYTVTVTDVAGCSASSSASITQPPLFHASVTPINEVCQGACDGSISTIVGGGVTPYTYQWSGSSSTTPSLNNLCSGNYSLTITDANHCIIDTIVTVGHDNAIYADGYAFPLDVPENTPVSFYFTGSNADTYNWDFGDGSAHSTLENPQHSYTTGGPNVTVYTVTLTITSGPNGICTSTITFTITVYIPSEILIPNIITPNGDGKNDIFHVVSKGLGSEKMMIYNRWGKKIYEWDVVGGSWDGKDGNRVFADATYYWIFTAKGEGDGKEYDANGTVTVLK